MKLIQVIHNPRKHGDARLITLRGISIDSSDENENAEDSMRSSRAFHSNESDEHDFNFASSFSQFK
jgi:hypothetical protein